MLPTYLLGVLVAISRYLLTLFLFGKRAGMRRGEQTLVDKYIPNLSPWLSTKKVELQSSYLIPSSFSNSPSVSTVTPSSFALSYFDPGSAPTTT